MASKKNDISHFNVDYYMLALYVLVGLVILYYAHEMFEAASQEKTKSARYWLSIALMVIAVLVPIVYIFIKF
jgi:uncharacterized membrane protein